MPLPDSQIESEYIAIYGLRTEFADWEIKKYTNIVGTADDDLAKAKTTAQLLIGIRAIGWNFVESSLGLEIKFEEGLSVRITPMADTEEDVSHKGAWILRMPDDYYRHVRWDGVLDALHKDEPASLEPPF